MEKKIMTKKQKILRVYLLNSLAILGIIIFLSYIGKDNISVWRRIVILGSINAIAAISLNLVSGCLGEMVLGHGGFMLIGAMTAAIVTRYWHVMEPLMTKYVVQFGGYVQMTVAILASAIAAGLIGLVVGMPILRLKGDYLAIVTLGFTLIMYSIGNNIKIGSPNDGYDVYIYGAQGINGLPNVVQVNAAYAVIVLVICIALLFLYMKTRFGRSILAIRDDHIAAEASGINVKKVRLHTFVLSSAVAGIAGGLFAFLDPIYPSAMSVDRSIEVLIIVVLGGLGSFTGSVLSAFFITILPIALVKFSAYQKLIYAIILLIVMLVKPTGLFGTKEFSWNGLVHMFKRGWFYITHPKEIAVKVKQGWLALVAKLKSKFKRKIKVKAIQNSVEVK